MGNQQGLPGFGGLGGLGGLGGDKKKQEEKKKNEKPKWQPPKPTRVGKKRKRTKGLAAQYKLPEVTPNIKCKLKQLRLERVKDFLLLEEEFLSNQEAIKPREEKEQEEKNQVEELRGTPLMVGTLEEIIDDNHAIVSQSGGGPESYVTIMSFVDRDLIEPGCTVLLHNRVLSIVGILTDDVDPLVNVMKVEKAPLESYADIGGLQKQIQEVKVLFLSSLLGILFSGCVFRRRPVFLLMGLLSPGSIRGCLDIHFSECFGFPLLPGTLRRAFSLLALMESSEHVTGRSFAFVFPFLSTRDFIYRWIPIMRQPVSISALAPFL